MLLGELLEDLNYYIRIYKDRKIILKIVIRKKDKNMFERLYLVTMRIVYETVRHIEKTTGKKIDKFIDNKMNIIYIREIQSEMKDVKPDTNHYFREISFLLKHVDRKQESTLIEKYKRDGQS